MSRTVEDAMLLPFLALGVLVPGLPPARADVYRIEGVVANGTRGDVPLAGAEVILRAGADGALQPVAKTTSDLQGHFAFDNLPVYRGLVYRAGANRQGIHYPGPRLSARYGTDTVTVRAYDTTSASPLIAERHELDIEIETGVMIVKEVLVVSNPTPTTYVGEAAADGVPATLSLHIPPGYERVTFADEFHGRHFQVTGGRVVTDIPWTPGQRELKFTYRLPFEERQKALQRALDLPTARVRLRVHGRDAEKVTSSLPRAAGNEAGVAVFESGAGSLGAGQAITVQFSRLSAPWIVFARWWALGLLVILIAGTALVLRGRRPRSSC